MEYKLSKGFIKRYKIFLKSDAINDIPEYSKSDYWKFHASQVIIQVGVNKITAHGKSGFYASSSITIGEGVRKILNLIKKPSKIIPRIKQKIGLSIDGIRLLSFSLSFDKVMGMDLISGPQLSPYRINFGALKQKDYIFSSVKKCKKDYFKISGGAVFSDHILVSYYYLNILNHYADFLNKSADRVVLEIGGGNGNLMSLIKWHKPNTTIIDVDIPETISHSILYLTSLFPSAKILMPNEVDSDTDFCSYDFVFLTPKQIYLIGDETVDLAINTHSFQEMTHTQISEYFSLIQRVGKIDSYFFSTNRVEKLPSGINSHKHETSVLPNRFSEYPWKKSNEIKVYEICRLFRLIQLDPIFNRLEKIKK
jgi:putative sugar O-methyltransferase